MWWLTLKLILQISFFSICLMFSKLEKWITSYKQYVFETKELHHYKYNFLLYNEVTLAWFLIIIWNLIRPHSIIAALNLWNLLNFVHLTQIIYINKHGDEVTQDLTKHLNCISNTKQNSTPNISHQNLYVRCYSKRYRRKFFVAPFFTFFEVLKQGRKFEENQRIDPYNSRITHIWEWTSLTECNCNGRNQAWFPQTFWTKLHPC